MTNKKKAETTIRVYADTKDELKKLKFGNEGDAVVIARLIKENKELKEEKVKLFDLLSVVNVPKVRINMFADVITNIINGNCADKLQVLKDVFNAKLLTIESIEVKDAIQIVKNNYDENNIPSALADFEVYVNGNH